jgi:hypothetical protein
MFSGTSGEGTVRCIVMTLFATGAATSGSTGRGGSDVTLCDIDSSTGRGPVRSDTIVPRESCLSKKASSCKCVLRLVCCRDSGNVSSSTSCTLGRRVEILDNLFGSRSSD